MDVAAFRKRWFGLKREVEEECCLGLFGLDLIRGEFLQTRDVLNYSHLEVFGAERFLRNFMQRTLDWDSKQAMPIIILTLGNEPEFLEKVFKIFSSNSNPENPNTFIRCAGALWKNAKWLPARSSSLFKLDECKYVYVELSSENSAMDIELFSYLDEQIKKLFDSRDAYRLMGKKPFIYLFYPEKYATSHSIAEYVDRMKASATFRIFSSQYVHVLDQNEKSMLFGPNPNREDEKMLKYCYQKLKERRKWEQENNFFGDSENDLALKMAKDLAKTIPIAQTAFGRFKAWDHRLTDFHWFYPARLSLGKMPYRPLPVAKAKRKPPVAKPKTASSDYDSSVADIIADLKPKRV